MLYEIHVDSNGDGRPDVTYRFRFETTIADPDTFLYNTGPITSLDATTWNRRQTYQVSRVDRRPGRRERETVLARGVPCPPCNIGPRSTPDYAALAASAARTLSDGTKVFAGQRSDPFFVDLGSVFDLGTLRPLQSLHLIPTANAPGVDTLKTSNVHAIAIQVPVSHLTRNGSTPTDPMSAEAVVGVWGAASRRKATILEGLNIGINLNLGGRRSGARGATSAGPWVQVSRLGNPLFNEVIVPMAHKDRWNALGPDSDREFARYVARPELARLLPVLYPGRFPSLAALEADRADLLAILLTGLPNGIIPGFQNFTGSTQADMLRLNVAIPPSASPHRLGLLGNDLAGFPNGRRLGDDVVTIELRAVAGVTYPLVAPGYTPDAAASLVEDGTFGNPGRTLLPGFPFVGLPYSGYDVPAA